MAEIIDKRGILGALEIDTDGYSTEFIHLFESIQRIVHSIAHEKGWWEDERNDGELIALMHSELSEALEGLRKDVYSDKLPDFKAVEEELADVVIRIMDYAESRNLRLAEAIIEKMKFNLLRSYKHGGKKF